MNAPSIGTCRACRRENQHIVYLNVDDQPGGIPMCRDGADCVDQWFDKDPAAERREQNTPKRSKRRRHGRVR